MFFPAQSQKLTPSNNLTTITSYPRLHVCLFDLGHATPRSYGGAGFAVAGLPAVVKAHPSSRAAVEWATPADTSIRKAVSIAIARLMAAREDAVARLQVLSIPPQHVGLGSKTATILGVLKAIDLACDLKLTKQDLQTLSGRGGTSGIGVNTFFTGGFIVDGGHDFRKSRALIPSRYRRRFEIPPVINRTCIPEEWRFTLVLAPGKSLSGSAEHEFFRRNTPIAPRQVFETIALAYHGIIPAVASGDLRLLRDALESVHKVGFKHRELMCQSSTVKAAIRALTQRQDCAVGLSSIGPLLYAVSHVDNHSFTKFADSLRDRLGVSMLGTFTGGNGGYSSQ